jgi:hypothetical protein
MDKIHTQVICNSKKYWGIHYAVPHKYVVIMCPFKSNNKPGTGGSHL